MLRPGRVSTAASLPLLGLAAVWPPLMVAYLRLRLSPHNRAVLNRSDARTVLEDTFTVGLRQGWRPRAYDSALVLRPLRFPVAEVPRPVQLWHGSSDWQASLVGARLLAAVMPTAQLRVVPRAGHLLAFDHRAEIIAHLTAP